MNYGPCHRCGLVELRSGMVAWAVIVHDRPTILIDRHGKVTRRPGRHEELWCMSCGLKKP